MSDTLSEEAFERIVGLERRLSKAELRLTSLEDLDDRVDGHDKDIEAIRSEMRGMRRDLTQALSDLSRVVDATTANSLVLEKVYSGQEHMIRLLTASVNVKE